MRRIVPLIPLLLASALTACSTTDTSGANGTEDSGEQSEPVPASRDERARQGREQAAENDNGLYERLFGEEERREREDDAAPDDDPTLFERFFGRDDGDGPRSEARRGAERQEALRMRQETARLNAADEAPVRRAPPDQGSRQGPAVGVIFVDGAGLQAPMLSALDRASTDYRLRVVTPGRVDPVLERYGCPAAAPTDCLRALAVQPGLRMLAVVEPAPGRGGRSQALRFRLFDTELERRYEPVTLDLPLTGGSPDPATWLAAADAVLLHAREHLHLTPPIAHAVAVEDGRIYLNQGAAIGLAPGSRLSVHGGARLLMGPAGTPAAWIPRARRGVIEVERIDDSGNAVARAVQGEPPTPSDYLIPLDESGG